MQIGRNIVVTVEHLNTIGTDYGYIKYYKGENNWMLFSAIPTNISDTIIISIADQVDSKSWALYFKNNTNTNIDIYCLWINRN